MKNAVAYLRISKNESKSVSLDYQLAEVQKTANSNGYKIVQVEVDNGISGKAMANRPGIQNVINLVNMKAIDAVCCYKSDRISRNGIQSIQFETMLAANSITYISVVEGVIGNASEDPLMAFLRGGLNQRERMIISIRTKAALQRKREKGERLGGGIKYGQSVNNGNIVQNTSEMAIVTRCRELRGLGYSTRKIATALNLEGFKPRRGTMFHQTTVCNILKAA